MPVLDVGLGLGALDFPEARHLDLALIMDSQGKSADLVERAAEGTLLVEPPSLCRQREARFDACEAALATGSRPEPSCPIVKDTKGNARIAREVAKNMTLGYPATLHDCRSAIANMQATERGMASSGAQLKKEARDATAFVEKSCQGRGHYAWKGDHFAGP